VFGSLHVESIFYEGQEFTVREVLPRPVGSSCRHLVSSDGDHQFLEYLVSVGPYKIDVACRHKLTTEQIAGYRSGAVVLGALARQLAAADESSGKHERT
jgi:hypothetical protein